MLKDIRQHVQGTTAKIVVGVIVITFALFGIESILVSGGGNEIAEVNGKPVYPQALQAAIDSQKRRLIAMMGENLDPAMLEDDRLRPQALEALINRELLMQSAANLDLAVSEDAIGKFVVGMEQFQIDGVFSPEAYKSVLASAGYTPALFKQTLREDMLTNQLRSGIAGSEFVTPAELAANAEVLSEQRDLQYLTIPKETQSFDSAFSNEQIESYYQSHQDQFQTPESVDLDYIELTLDNYRQPVEESAIREAYELAVQDAQYQTQNRVSHILFEDGNSAPERIAQAQAALAAGTAFADVARKFSDDKGTAGKGGDLGYSSGQTFPEPMESAIQLLEPGVVSEPVKTDAGTHLLLVTERKPGEKPSLEELREQLVDSLQADEARVTLLRNVESLRDLSFNADDLAYPAKELGLTVKQENAVTRSQNEGLFSNQALLDAAFSDDVLASGHNSDVIELKGDQFVVLRIRKHNAPEIKPLSAVREEVTAALAEEIARAALTAEASKVLDQINSGVELDVLQNAAKYQIQTELGVSRSNTTVPTPILQRAFELPVPGAGQTVADYKIMPNGDAVIIKLLGVQTGAYKSLPETEQMQLERAVTGELANLADAEFQNGLRESAEITVL